MELETFAPLLLQLGAAVITALVTTVAVEALAKPRLEARKERLVRDRKQIDEVIFAFQRLGMHLGSVIPGDTAPDESLLREIRQRQVTQISPLVQDLLIAIGRLSTRYVIKHGEHIGWTTRYLGFMSARGELAAQDVYVPDAWIRELADDLPKFDVYFVVHVDFRDSQEWLVKRWFWKRFTASGYRAEVMSTMTKYGGVGRLSRRADERDTSVH